MTSPLTVQQLAEIEQVHPDTIRGHIRSGRLIARKVGKGYRIDPQRIEEWRRAMETRNQDRPKDSLGFPQRRSRFKPRLIDGGDAA